ncbi:MAG: STAS domain-containing protein [Magnetococcales bacterium]|nr:STAS domain-containing protein [Magnetococcales bacterium]
MIHNQHMYDGITVESETDCTTYHVFGRFNYLLAKHLLKEFRKSTSEYYIINLKQVQSVDASAIGTIAYLLEKTNDLNVSIIIEESCEQVRQVFSRSKIKTVYS